MCVCAYGDSVHVRVCVCVCVCGMYNTPNYL